MLIGLIAAVSVLQLPGTTNIIGPLNTFVSDVAHFIPRLIGAVLIFFIGYIVATLVRRLIEGALAVGHVDAWLERVGLNRMTGASGLSRTAGTIAFVLILIPAAIAALQQLGIRAISDPAITVLSMVLTALPRLLAAAIVLAIAFLIARWVANLIEQLLPSLGFDRSLQSLTGTLKPAATTPLTAEVPITAGFTPSKVVAQIVLWAIMLFSAVEAARLLEFVAIASMLQQVLELAGHVVFGAVIITAGVLIAQVLSDMIDRATNKADGFASTLVKWATIALATAMGLRFMGIADEIVILAFGLILGSAAVAAAIAFGLGGREAAGRVANRWADQAEDKIKSTPDSETPLK